MKASLLVSALSCALLGNTNAQVNTVKKETISTDENINKKASKMSHKEKLKYYFTKLDELHSRYYTDQTTRFYLLDLEPKLSEPEFESRRAIINKLIDEALDLILRTMQPTLEIQEIRNDGATLKMIKDRMSEPRGMILGGSLSKEVYLDDGDEEWADKLGAESFEEAGVSMLFTYLKGGNEYGKEKYEDQIPAYRRARQNSSVPRPVPGYRNYNLGDFEYKEFDTPAFKKKRLIEKRYEIIYLHLKAAGLIRATPSAFYPKSFLREYADQTKLSQFIHDEEAKAGKQLQHDDLAIRFFGSYDSWMTGFEKFLQNKLNTLKAGE